MSREIKLREFVNGKFHYWGFIDVMFKGPVSPGLQTQSSFTGLKDKNGKDVYESDVIRIKQGECVGMSADGSVEEWIEIQGQVLFEDAMFVFEGHSAGTLPLSAYKDEIEVIGNIYSNPELLNP